MAKSNKKYRTGKSKIQGKGVFAKQNLKPGDYIGKAHTINKLYTDYDFTDLGKNHNHSDTPNTQNVLIGNERHFVAIKPIKKGQEITTDYRLQPDLEQPEDFEKGGKMTPQKDGYRWYSPYKDLNSIEVNSNTIDTDGIVYDLLLVGDDGSQKFVEKNTGTHILPNSKRVTEYPIKAQNGIEGTMGGLTDKGFNYNGAWGGPSMKTGGWLDNYQTGGNIQPPMAGAMQPMPTYAMGGSLPGSVGFMYARTQSPAPSNGPYAKKTMPSAQNGIEYPQAEGLTDIDRFAKEYVNSANFKRLSKLQGDKPWMTRMRRKIVNKFDPNEDVSYAPEGFSYVTGGNKPGTEKMILSAEMGDWPSYSNITAHEYGHLGYNDEELQIPDKALGRVEGANAAYQYNMRTGEMDEDIEHDIAGQENRADLFQLRYQLDKKGIFDSRKKQPFTKEHLEKFKQSGESNRMQRLYDDEDIIWMMNNVAKNNNLSSSNTAKDGGWLNKYKDGGNMSYYQHGLDWKPKTISENGSIIPKAQTGKRLDVLKVLMNEMEESQKSKKPAPAYPKKYGLVDPRDLARQNMGYSTDAEYAAKARDNAIANAIEKEVSGREKAESKRTFIGPAREKTKQDVQKEKMMKRAYVSANPNAGIDEKGNLYEKNPERTLTGKAKPNTRAARYDKALEHTANALDAASTIVGAAQATKLGYKAVKELLAESMESGALSKVKDAFKGFGSPIKTYTPLKSSPSAITISDDGTISYISKPNSSKIDLLKKMFKGNPQTKRIDYSKKLSNTEYKKWKNQLFGKDDAALISDKELKEAHEESRKFFKDAVLTQNSGTSDASSIGGKEHGLYIKNKFAGRIPNYTKVTFDDAGQRLYRYPLHSSESSVLPDEKTLEKLRNITNEAFQREQGYDISKLTPEERLIMESYAHGYDASMNNALRFPSQSKTSQFYQDAGETLNRGILKNKFETPTEVKRGISSNYEVELLDPITFKPTGVKKMRSELDMGDVFKDESFMSTSTKELPWGEKSLSETIEIPGGRIQSLGVPEAADITTFRGENEAILPKGLIRQIIGVSDEGATRFRTKILNPYALVPFGLSAGLFRNSQEQKQKDGGWLNKYK